MNNATFIIFGATGDLARRKLFTAIHKLIEDNKLDNFAIIGCALEDTSVENILSSSKSFISHFDQNIWDKMHERMSYYQSDVTDGNSYKGLAQLVTDIEQKYNLKNRLIYCATAADFFSNITHHLADNNILVHADKLEDRWHRIVYEKPFGKNKQHAHEINICIQKNLSESQVFRIDHYLTKEVVTNIALVRFTNIVLEPLWRNNYIDQVHIILSEDFGIAGRGWYYDQYGAIRDVVQNHALELLALVAMEQPEHLSGEHIRNERARVLKKVEFIDGIRGQYDSYQQEGGVKKDSDTETFACLKFAIDNDRWRGVPFIVKAGKNLSKKETVIHIKFKQIRCLLTEGCPTESNWLTIQIDPEAILLLTLNAKKPGQSIEMVPVGMEFCHSCLFGPRTPEAYEVLFEEILRGEQSISVRSDEIEYAWDVIEQIDLAQLPLYAYQEKSNGPNEMQEFEKLHNIRWKQ